MGEGGGSAPDSVRAEARRGSDSSFVFPSRVPPVALVRQVRGSPASQLLPRCMWSSMRMKCYIHVVVDESEACLQLQQSHLMICARRRPGDSSEEGLRVGSLLSVREVAGTGMAASCQRHPNIAVAAMTEPNTVALSQPSPSGKLSTPAATAATSRMHGA